MEYFKLNLLDETLANRYPVRMSNSADNAEWLTVSQVAQRLRVAGRTVRRWIELGHFPGTERTSPQKKAEYRIPLEAVIAFESNRKVN